MKYVILAEPTTLVLGGLLLMFFVALAVVGVVALLIVYLFRKTKSAAPPAPPTITPFAQSGFPKCPRCGAPLPPDSPEGLCPRCLIALNLATQTEITGEPGAAKPPPAPPLPVADVAKLFPQLEILECLGRGGMGTVYKARQPRLDRIIALKVLSPEKQGNQKFAERFEREARALAKLHHPNIVTVYDFGEARGNFYLLMEFVDGLTLRQLLQARKLSPDEALAIVPKICEALQYAHEQGIIHRDIKPENILMDKEGRVKIADFGIAKILGDGGRENLTEEQAIGTPHYMSPEQIEKPQTVDHRADIYSLGVVFYEMLTGELPLGKFQPPSQKVHIDVRLDEIVLRALEKEPERRYQQASEVKTRVETIAQTPPPIAGAPPDVASFIQTALARDCSLNICHCLNRGWNLVISDFWRVVGVSALIWLLTSLATSSVLGIIIRYPLIGGLWLYYLNRVRGNPVTVETAFSGFKVAFLRLVLVGLIAKILTILGLVCLILPGIYLWVAWTFAVALVADRQLDFWPAMELSRKIISRHWWKFFWFLIVLALIYLAGFMFCYVGIFVATPLCMASLAYAYEDIFGPVAGTVGKIPAGAPVRLGSGFGTAFGIAAGAAAAVIFIVFLGFLMSIAIPAFVDGRHHAIVLREQQQQRRQYAIALREQQQRRQHAIALREQQQIEAKSHLLISQTWFPLGNHPHVVSVWPPDGATNVDAQQDLRIRFNRPMNPNDMDIMWFSGGFLTNGQPLYDAIRNEFVIPMQLLEGTTNKLEIGWAGEGFRDTNGNPADKFDWQFATKPFVAKAGAATPQVTQISPAEGQALPVLTFFHISFDQPMTLADGLPYMRQMGTSDLPSIIPDFAYDPVTHCFTIPVILPPDNETKLTLEGFHSADGIASDSVVIRCEIGTNNYSLGQFNEISTAADDLRLKSLLTSMKEARAHYQSGIETVQCISVNTEKSGFSGLSVYPAIFKWQGTNQFYEDISGVMNVKAFVLGTDGKTCWLYSNSKDYAPFLNSSPVASVPDIDASVADPFHLIRRSVASAIAKGKLIYEGESPLDGRICYRVEAWSVEQTGNDFFPVQAGKYEWWIDSQTFLPVQVVENAPNYLQTLAFHYEGLNQPLPDSTFQPPVEPGTSILPADWFNKKLGRGEIRFLTIKDGCDGKMSGRMGRQGPNGSESSGLN